MNIFFITSKLNFQTAGGSVEEFDLMIRTLQKWGNQVTVVTAFSQGNDWTAPLPYPVIEEKIIAAGLLRIQWGIYRILKKYSAQADVFHLDGHLFLYGAGLYRRLGGKVPVSAFFNRELSSWPENRSIFFPHAPEPALLRLKKKIRWLMEKYFGMPLANGIDVWSTISPQFKKKYEEFGLKSNEHTQVIGDPIDFKRIIAENVLTEDTYSRRNKEHGPFLIFYSSRMAPGKGFDMLLKGFSKVKNKDDFRLILGGSGPEEALVNNMIKELDLEKYVELPGWMSKEQLFNYHRRADIFIQADWMVFGTSISLLYAMAFGLPCILPGGGGLEWVANDCAIYFKNHDPEDLAKKIEQLGNDAALRAKLSRNCYRRLATDGFDFEKQIGKLYEGLKQIVHHTAA